MMNQFRSKAAVALVATLVSSQIAWAHGHGGGGGGMARSSNVVTAARFQGNQQLVKVNNQQLVKINNANLLGSSSKKIAALPIGPIKPPVITPPVHPVFPVGPIKPPVITPPVHPVFPVGPIGPIKPPVITPPVHPVFPVGPIGPIKPPVITPPVHPVFPVGPIGPIKPPVVTPPTTPPTTPPCPTQPGCGTGSYCGGGFVGFPFPFPIGGFGGYGSGGYVGGGYVDGGVVDSQSAVASAPVTVASAPGTGRVDLVVEDIRMVQPATLIAGPAYQVKFRNQGTLAAGTFRVGIFAALDGKASDAARALVDVPGLAAGEVGEVTLRLPAAAMKLVSVSTEQPAPFSQLMVAVDPDNLIVESDKTNNVATVDRSAVEAN
jgi:hypothetical protein